MHLVELENRTALLTTRHVQGELVAPHTPQTQIQ